MLVGVAPSDDVRDLRGPWLLFDNQRDPYQLENLANHPDHARLQVEFEATLTRKLKEAGDKFLPATAYIDKWGYVVNENGTVPYAP